jgi:hypothetical protein
VNRTGIFGVSLVSAIPGAILAIVMVLVFVNYAGGPSILTKVLAGLMLLSGLALAAMPAAIWLFLAPKQISAEKAAGAAAEPKQEEAEVAVEEPAEPAEGIIEDDAVDKEVPQNDEESEFDLGADFVVDDDEDSKRK